MVETQFVYPNLGNDTAICSNTVYQLRPSNYAQYLWSTTSTSSSKGIGQAGLYWVKVTDINGCTGTVSIHVLPKECLKGFFMPTAFTPNNDGKNDILKPILYGNVKQYQFSIFNRRGANNFQ